MFIFKKIETFFQRQPKRILTESGIVYILNENEKTAVLEKDTTSEGDIIIPRSIIYKSEEYIVTNILENAFNSSININSIQFPEDSEIKSIGEGAFFFSSIQSISIPPKLFEIPRFFLSSCYNLRIVDIPENSELNRINGYSFSKSTITSLYIPPKAVLQPHWCSGTTQLNRVTISPKNDHYCEYEGQFILGKCDENLDIYDSLVFAPRNIEIAIIPSFIKKISVCAFDCCEKLKKIEFLTSPSELIIDENAFSYSSLSFISIPSNVTLICDSAFFCTKLQKVNFIGQSKLNTIESFAFSCSKIRTFSVPSSVLKIGKSSFEACSILQKVDFSLDSKLEFIDEFAFAKTPICSFKIPSSVKKVGSKILTECDKLVIIEIAEFSSLNLFESSCVYLSNPIIMVPQNTNIIFN